VSEEAEARKWQRVIRASVREVCQTRRVQAPRVGNYRLRRFTGEYDLLGNQFTTPGQITFDSVSRFKGQESKPGNPLNERLARL
jgi:hypothetical protein